jgi:hypothetical protein
MTLIEIKKAIVLGAYKITPDEFIKAYKKMIANNLQELTYDSNTLELFKYSESYTFKIDETFFAIHKNGKHYASWFTPFTEEGNNIEALNLCIDLGIDITFHDKVREKLGVSFESTYQKFDAYTYSNQGIIDNYNAAGRNNSRRKINKLRSSTYFEVIPANELTVYQKEDISELEKQWFEVVKKSNSFYSFNFNQLVKNHFISDIFNDTFVILFRNREDGKPVGYSCTEIIGNKGIEYIRKSIMQGSHYEYMTIVQMETLKQKYNIELMDFGAARFWYGKSMIDRVNEQLYKTKSSLPHELHWVHTSGYDMKKFNSVDIEASRELF